MLQWLRTHKLAVSVGGVLLAALVLVLSSQSFQSCIGVNSYGDAQQSKPESADHIIGIWWWCTGILLNENGVAITAIATIVMAAFTGTLWWSTASTGKLTERTVELAEKQFLMEGRQTDLAERQHGLQRLQHLAVNRPSLAIRNVEIRRPTADGPLFEPDAPINGWLVVVNTGASGARILSAEYRFFTSNNGLPMAPPLVADRVRFLIPDLPYDMAAHESHRAIIESVALGPKARYIVLGGPDHLYVMGAIRYSDATQAEHWMGFCREFVPNVVLGGEGSFVPVENPDYEYQD